jgi:hypothetical protein
MFTPAQGQPVSPSRTNAGCSSRRPAPAPTPPPSSSPPPPFQRCFASSEPWRLRPRLHSGAGGLYRQLGGRVFLFLKTDDFDRDYEALSARGVRFVREPKEAPYGKVAVFEDLYGNLWDLVQPSTVSRTMTSPPAPAFDPS